jgi:hypothetical protein
MTNPINIKTLSVLPALVRYNLKVIFGNRFIYFFAASLLFYLLITSIALFSDEVYTAEHVYYQLLFPALLLIFFPTVFGIQNDVDARMIEIIFGIPNYRYKVYLIRLAMIVLMEFGYLILLSLLSNFILVNLPVGLMAIRLLVPVLFFGMLGFGFSTVVKNGNGTVVVVVIVGLLFWILTDVLQDSKWNVFLNPFYMPDGMSQMVWENVVTQNRLILLCSSAVLLLWGILNLQQREKFMK